MKVKTSFITNSSSSVFIILVPDDFVIEEVYLSNTIEKITDDLTSDYRMYKEFNNHTKEDLMEKIRDTFESFKEGSQYVLYEWKDEDYIEWRTILQICEENSLILVEIDLPGPGNTLIQSLSHKVIIETITGYINIEKFMQPFLREKGDDKENTKEK